MTPHSKLPRFRRALETHSGCYEVGQSALCVHTSPTIAYSRLNSAAQLISLKHSKLSASSFMEISATGEYDSSTVYTPSNVLRWRRLCLGYEFAARDVLPKTWPMGLARDRRDCRHGRTSQYARRPCFAQVTPGNSHSEPYCDRIGLTSEVCGMQPSVSVNHFRQQFNVSLVPFPSLARR